MAKLNLLLLLVLIVCALGLVTSQHKSRKLFTELEKGYTLFTQTIIPPFGR